MEISSPIPNTLSVSLSKDSQNYTGRNMKVHAHERVYPQTSISHKNFADFFDKILSVYAQAFIMLITYSRFSRHSYLRNDGGEDIKYFFEIQALKYA